MNSPSRQFQGDNATKMLAAYGAFCSRHKDAVAFYKEMLKADKKFALFIAVRSSSSSRHLDYYNNYN